ncbi:MAG: hypothetical protein KF773_24225 [Deltaproteobacteria bacterium]|nr:hypothetical protein [Deltaproteobacteria bacterium]
MRRQTLGIYVHGAGCSCLYCSRSAGVPRQPDAPVVDLDASRAKASAAALQAEIDRLRDENDHLRQARHAAEDRMHTTERQLVAVRVRLTEVELQLESATREAERMTPVVDAAFAFRIASGREVPRALADLVDASDAYHTLDAYSLEGTTPDDARERAAALGTTLTTEYLVGDEVRQLDDVQLDPAGAARCGGGL